MKAAALTRTDTHTKTHAHTSSGASIACVLLLCCSSVAALVQLCCSSCSQQWREHRLRATALLQLCCCSVAALLQQLQSAVARASPTCYCSVAATNFACFTRTKVQTLTPYSTEPTLMRLCARGVRHLTKALARLCLRLFTHVATNTRRYELYLLYQYKSTNTDALSPTHAASTPPLRCQYVSVCRSKASKGGRNRRGEASLGLGLQSRSLYRGYAHREPTLQSS
jgi:hypothetical protein